MFPLPWELNQLIVDNLFDDPRTLRATTLVCKRAVPFARRHLFYTVTINFDKDGYHRWERFQNVIRCSSFGIGEHVRHLHVLRSNYAWFSQNTWSFVTLLPILQELTIESADWTVWHPSDNESPRQLPLAVSATATANAMRMRTVTKLTLNGVTWRTFEELALFLVRFPDLATLELKHSAIGQGATYYPSTVFRSTSLRSLHLEDVDKDIVLNWWTMFPSPPALRSLSLRKISLQEADIVACVLKLLGHSLRYLDISFRVDGNVCESAAKIDLRHNTSLRTLVFDDWSMSGWVPRDWCPQIIRTLRSTQLERIAFYYRAQATFVLPIVACGPMLNKLSFPALTSVGFVNRTPWDEKQERQELIDHLPDLATRGLLDYRAEREGMAKGFPWGYFIHCALPPSF